jgi:Flp pilus assembly pilin Flp
MCAERTLVHLARTRHRAGLRVSHGWASVRTRGTLKSWCNCSMLRNPCTFWSSEEGQDVAEYAVILAVILIIIIGTIRLIGGNANNVFSSVASSVQ